jgi:surface protein
MSNMFWHAIIFNQDISQWNTKSVTNMNNMFYNAFRFNQNISNWNVSAVINMGHMFRSALCFDQDISQWDVSSVTNMNSMFSNAVKFNQDLLVWNVGINTQTNYMFNHTPVLLKYERYNLKNPFKLPNTHPFYNWSRRKMYIRFTHIYDVTAFELPEMVREIGAFI